MLQPGQDPWGLPGCSTGQPVCSTGGWVLLPLPHREGTLEHLGGDAASWVAPCPSQPLTLQPGLPAQGQPASYERMVMGTSLRPHTTLVDNGSPFFRGWDRAARIRGHRELCLCLIWQPDVLDGSGVTAKTLWGRGCHLGNSLPSSWHVWACNQKCQLSLGLLLAATVAKKGVKTEMCNLNRSETQSAPIRPARWHQR